MKIGILGGGQLARMLAISGAPLGLEFVFYEPRPEACVRGLGECIRGAFDDAAALTRFADAVDVITYEFESIPLTALQELPGDTPILPGLKALETTQDRLREKRFFERLGIPVAKYFAIDDPVQLAEAACLHGEAMIVKARQGGYDGKGQGGLSHPDQAERLWQTLGERPLIAEQRIEFTREVSLIAVRNRRGDKRFYPLVENVHRDGILIHSRPLQRDALQSRAEAYAIRVMNALEYVGVLTLEFFDYRGELFVNEFAPRVHNSGHWTIEANATSQFENHLRAIADLPLGDTGMREECIMYNCIGRIPDRDSVLEVPAAHLHDYGKRARPGRKLGHVTLCKPSRSAMRRLETLLEPGPPAVVAHRARDRRATKTPDM